MASGWWPCVVLLLACFFAAGQAPPHVNEAHYLCKAKQFHDPDFAAGDFFLESRNVHTLFYVTFGQLTNCFELPTVAWIGRWINWSLLSLALVVVLRSTGARGSLLLAGGLAIIGLTPLTAMAGEWIVGGTEAKGPAFALAILAVAAVSRGRWDLAVLLCGFATAWHALIGGWLGLLCLVGGLLERGPKKLLTRSYIVMGILAAFGVLYGIFPALRLNHGVSPETCDQAAQIYVFRRLGHHLLFSRFAPSAIASHFALWGAFVLLWIPTRSDPQIRRVGHLVFGAGGLMLAGILLSILSPIAPQFAADSLRLYWFRTADWLLPLGVVFLLVRFYQSQPVTSIPRKATLLASLILFLAAYPSFLSRWSDRHIPPASEQAGVLLREPRDYQIKRMNEWQEVCGWIKDNTPQSSIWITPQRQQTFKWYSSRAEVVNWKDIPQSATGIHQWWQRHQELYPSEVTDSGLVAHGEDQLRKLATKYGATWILIDRRQSKESLSFPQIYPTEASKPGWFVIYRIPTEQK